MSYIFLDFIVQLFQFLLTCAETTVILSQRTKNHMKVLTRKSKYSGFFAVAHFRNIVGECSGSFFMTQ